MAIDLFEAMYTQRAVRRFRTDPVPDESITKLLEAATRAPNGGNRQTWRFLVIKDQRLRSQIADYYRRAFYEVNRPADPSSVSPSSSTAASAAYLAEHLADVPVFVIPCAPRPSSGGLGSGSSIYPAAQNLMLAARGLGLGTVITSLHKRYEKEVKALLGIPDDMETAALIPVGYPLGRGFGPLDRKPVREVSFLDRWGNAFQG